MPELVFCSHCESPAKYRGLKLCAMHYQRIRATGSPDLRLPEPCVVPECFSPRKAFGYCRKHWGRVLTSGSPEPKKWSHRGVGQCAVPGCGGLHRCMGLCAYHYHRELRKGHPLWQTLMRQRLDPSRPWIPEQVTDSALLTTFRQRQKATPTTQISDRGSTGPLSASGSDRVSGAGRPRPAAGH